MRGSCGREGRGRCGVLAPGRQLHVSWLAVVLPCSLGEPASQPASLQARGNEAPSCRRKNRVGVQLSGKTKALLTVLLFIVASKGL